MLCIVLLLTWSPLRKELPSSRLLQQPSQNQAATGSPSCLLEMFDHLLSKGPIAFSCIQESLSLLLPTNNLLFKIFLRWLLQQCLLQYVYGHSTSYCYEYRYTEHSWCFRWLGAMLRYDPQVGSFSSHSSSIPQCYTDWYMVSPHKLWNSVTLRIPLTRVLWSLLTGQSCTATEQGSMMLTYMCATNRYLQKNPLPHIYRLYINAARVPSPTVVTNILFHHEELCWSLNCMSRPSWKHTHNISQGYSKMHTATSHNCVVEQQESLGKSPRTRIFSRIWLMGGSSWKWLLI